MIEDYKKYPRYYFKYLPFNKRTINSLKNHEFWFSDPSTFNDPFDCKIELDFEITVDELEKYYEITNKNYTEIAKSILLRSEITLTEDLAELARFIKFILKTPSLNDDFVFQRIDDILNKGKLIYPEWIIKKRIGEFKSDPVEFMKHIEKVPREEIKSYRIFCLSKTKMNTTMWTHYSDDHKGICIKFDSFQDREFFSFPLKVFYKADYPLYNYIRKWEQHGAFKHMVRNKYINWRYEKEYRIVKDTRKTNFKMRGLLKINKASIKEVSFGLKANQCDIEYFQRINNKYYENKILVFKAKEKPKSYDLDFYQIK